MNLRKISNQSSKDPILDDLKSFLVDKFTCPICSSSYIGETCRHFKTRIEKHIIKDNKSHISKHLHSSATCFDSYNSLSFKIIDKASSKFDWKTKEALHINWRKPNLNSLCYYFISFQNTLNQTFLFLLLFSFLTTILILMLRHSQSVKGRPVPLAQRNTPNRSRKAPKD